MESHPIPQQISSYQFRLVGDMTLKQFFQLGGGVLVAVIIYSTHMLPIFKWPLMIFSAGLGAAMAFLPFEERPLSKWIFSFFHSIYSPTIFYWQKQSTLPIFFQEEAKEPAFTNIAAPQGQAVLSSYLKTLPQAKEEGAKNLESQEASFLSKITTFLGPSPTKGAPTGITQLIPLEIPDSSDRSLKIPETLPISVPKSTRPKIVIEEEIKAKPEVSKPSLPTMFPPISKKAKFSGQAAKFSQEAAPPHPPSIPNTISGQILSDKGKIIEGAILEVRDLAGRPVRALRSNKLGHFMVVTALANGQYEIITEKDGFRFDPVTFTASGEIIPPMAISAKESYEVKNAPYTGKPLIIN